MDSCEKTRFKEQGTTLERREKVLSADEKSRSSRVEWREKGFSISSSREASRCEELSRTIQRFQFVLHRLGIPDIYVR